jgi:hypothetical protein
MESTAGKGVDFDAPLIAKPYRKNDLARVLDEVLKRPEMGPAPEANAGARADRLTGVRWQQ